jgi:hypothetical protein
MNRPRALLGTACLAAAAALAACAGTGTSAAGAGAPADARTSSLEADRELYEAKCGVCHVPFHREDFEPAEWPDIVETFAPRAGLTQAQRARVLRWLQAR